MVDNGSHNTRGNYGQINRFAKLPMFPLSASMEPAHRNKAEALSELQKSLLGDSKDKALLYVLSDPRSGEVRYIGRTVHLANRYMDHVCRRTGVNAMHRWMAELWAAHMRPVLTVIEIVDRAEMVAREYYWIRRLSRICRLTNSMYVKRKKSVGRVKGSPSLF